MKNLDKICLNDDELSQIDGGLVSNLDGITPLGDNINSSTNCSCDGDGVNDNQAYGCSCTNGPCGS